MKVLHCCLSNFYVDGYAYQENMLVKEHISKGHDVLVLASTEVFSNNNVLGYTNPCDYIGLDGARVIRVPYVISWPLTLMKKLRIHSGVFEIINNFNPDVILFHGTCGWDLRVVKKYIVINPHVKFYVDNHADFNNSAKNKFAYYFLYKFYYVPILKSVKKYVDKFLYTTPETKKFCVDVFELCENELEYFPLGGKVLSDEQYYKLRKITRENYNYTDDHVVFFQSGKFDKKKKLLDTILAFKELNCINSSLIIAGSFCDDVFTEIEGYINGDDRITYVGWIDSNSLSSLLCAADVYVQPGSQSVTLQMSICARCAVIAADVLSHRSLVLNNGYLVSNYDDLLSAFTKITSSSTELRNMSISSYDFASKNLDYSILADRILK